MTEKRTTTVENGLIWFGAAVSIAEILTGMYFAPLGFERALQTILIGHLIGGILMFAVGLIGAKLRLSAMESVKVSFGEKGGYLFAVLNVVQLLGWTAIMIYDGALAAHKIWAWDYRIWAFIIGILIFVWILIGVKNLGFLNKVAMTALFILTLILSKIIFIDHTIQALPATDALSYGAAIELSVAMPLSWLPVISDYTREAKHPVKASAVSTIVYGLVSVWMYVIGMGAALVTGGSDITVMMQAGLGIAALLIVVFSTVTTTFLDVFSVGVSWQSIRTKSDEKKVAMVALIIGTALAMIFPMDDITEFLYFIGSVFVPMSAILLADFFVLKHQMITKKFFIQNLIIWAIGFYVYRSFMTYDLWLGSTIPAMAIVFVLTVVIGKLLPSR